MSHCPGEVLTPQAYAASFEINSYSKEHISWLLLTAAPEIWKMPPPPCDDVNIIIKRE